MEDISDRGTDARMPLTKLRDWAAIGVRHRRWVALSFLGVFFGAALVAALAPPTYQANTKILVKRDRLDPLVSADSSSPMPQIATDVTEMELNSEIELIKSRDLLEKVVLACGLENTATRFWPYASRRAGDPNDLAAALRNLQAALKVELVSKTNLISITYEAANPHQAAQVLNTLVSLYMEKHMAVHQPAGTFEFFQKQTQQYAQGLALAESHLVEFSRTQGVVSPEQQKVATLQKLSEFQAELKQTQASLAETVERIGNLETQSRTLPPRMTTAVRMSDNPQLMGQLKSTLLSLELKRTELLEKFEPTYRLVVEQDTQIAQTRAAIEAAEKSQLREETTDRNPIYQWVDSELAKARSDLAAGQARAEALGRSVRSYEEQASSFDQKEVVEQGLLRDEKAQEANYLLYQRKQEEARISNALDRSRIVNVAVAEEARVPAVPSRSRPSTLLAGLLAAIAASIAAAAAAEYLNPSLKTSDDVKIFLNVPVLASVSSRGR
jgi:uncharacterized protein involved in exopolysaccharide biosynthesis